MIESVQCLPWQTENCGAEFRCSGSVKMRPESGHAVPARPCLLHSITPSSPVRWLHGSICAGRNVAARPHVNLFSPYCPTRLILPTTRASIAEFEDDEIFVFCQDAKYFRVVELSLRRLLVGKFCPSVVRACERSATDLRANPKVSLSSPRPKCLVAFAM